MKIQDYLQRENMSIVDFVAASGICRSTIYHLMMGIPPRMPTIVKLMRATKGQVGFDDYFDMENFDTEKKPKKLAPKPD